jgi:predicted nuclease of predicted toxin-antitoxin system
MRLLANENFPGLAVAALRAAGHDTLWARTDLAGWRDEEILKRAEAEERILLTFDKDFGDLAFRAKLPATCGIILCRMSTPLPEIVANRVVAELGSRSDWAGKFAVIEDYRVRIRLLPSGNP